ncbi:hypothetical protein [Flavobacterium piscisymbiosum]|uniref:Uncharacterized protein n=1 Tax=Flavobacterium piscisymbiosum TaxID=2893753 RepID=A0ABS8MI78_9FLAO|nr:hypothetical protein [Flavobacterium sp. F-30]MCC9065179.1 hypothetical protein [Flavobacterium sp. F-30]
MNTAIKNNLWSQFETTKEIFLAKKDLHPLFEQFKFFISEINIEKLISQFESEIELNISEWWINKERDIDLNSKLFAILFTYGDLKEKLPQALVYGINQIETPLKKQLETYDLGWHEYADGYYALPGINLDFCQALQKLNYKNLEGSQDEEIDWYELEGRIELFNTYKFAIAYALHESLNNLMQLNKLISINSVVPLHFLLQQYDEDVTPLLILE